MLAVSWDLPGRCYPRGSSWLCFVLHSEATSGVRVAHGNEQSLQEGEDVHE